MVKSVTAKTNGNVFKTIVRTVVREEVPTIVRKEMKPLGEELRGEFTSFKEEMSEKMENLYTKYRDDVLIKLDAAIGKLKKTDEEQTMHSGQHQDISDRLDGLESIHPRGKHP